MILCLICKKEKDKSIYCKLLNNDICLSCCFIIAAGRAEILKRMKNSYSLDKETVINQCEACQAQMLK